MKQILRRLWTVCFVGAIGYLIWLYVVDHRTAAQKAADDAKQAEIFIEMDRRLIEQIEKECGKISAEAIVKEGALGCVEAVEQDFYGFWHGR
jgi:hypothetical protein